MNSRTKMPLIDRKHFILACALTTLFALSIIAAVVLMTTNHTKQPPATQPTAITVNGNLTCLPHKNTQPGQPQTLECAIGLKTDDGRYYGLKNMSQQDSAVSFSQHITVTGDVLPPSADDHYDTRGDITVKTLQAK